MKPKEIHNITDGLALRANAAIEKGDALIIKGLEHYWEAGGYLIEAKTAVPHGEWQDWVAENIDKSHTQCKKYMLLRSKYSSKKPLQGLSGIDKALGYDAKPEIARPPPVPRPEPEVMIVDVNDLNRRAKELHGSSDYFEGSAGWALEQLGIDTRRETISEEALNALYKYYAMKNHPDRGGNNESMSRINKARAILSQ